MIRFLLLVLFGNAASLPVLAARCLAWHALPFAPVRRRLAPPLAAYAAAVHEGLTAQHAPPWAVRTAGAALAEALAVAAQGADANDGAGRERPISVGLAWFALVCCAFLLGAALASWLRAALAP